MSRGSSRPDAPFHITRVTPGAVGWVRIGLAALLLVGVPVLLFLRNGASVWPWALLAVLVLLAVTIREFMQLWLKVVVAEDGVTVSRGGFAPRPVWPVSDFRSVQIRTIEPMAAGSTLGGFGWRRAEVPRARMDQLEAVDNFRCFNSASDTRDTAIAVTRGGRLVEIVGTKNRNFLLSPTDPDATAAAIAQLIRSRR